MRTIKFRGKDKKSGKWVYGDLTHTKGITPLGSDTMTYPRVMVAGYEVEEDSVGQFTGLKDRNGNEIYEGDIVIDPIFRDLVETKEGDGVASEVVFDDGAFVVNYYRDQFVYLDVLLEMGIEVIGNAFDNKELI